MNNKQRIEELLKKYSESELTKEEINELQTLVDIENFNIFHDEADNYLIKES